MLTLDVGDPPETWSELGFAVDGDVCRIGDVTHRLGADGRGVRAWSLGVVDGLRTTNAAGDAAVTEHANGVVALDHLVVSTPDMDRTVAALEAAGFELRRTREAGPIRQAFFKVGDVILELAGPAAASGDGPARFWGLAFTVADLDATASYLGDRLRPAKDAVQPGRRIATLDKSAGSTVAIAFMSPEP
ncbi:MAG TPA: VOC family protein [Acidimicrobiales bacterium]|nr:VOC family protein [Acidimicrobiales bacterium]